MKNILKIISREESLLRFTVCSLNGTSRHESGISQGSSEILGRSCGEDLFKFGKTQWQYRLEMQPPAYSLWDLQET